MSDQDCCQDPAIVADPSPCPDLTANLVCDLDRPYLTAQKILAAAEQALTINDVFVPATRFVSWGTPHVSPACCEVLAVGIQTPGIDPFVQEGSCWVTQKWGFEIVYSMCRPKPIDNAVYPPFGEATGEDLTTVQGHALLLARATQAILFKIRTCLCCVGVVDPACVACNKLAIAEVQTLPARICDGVKVTLRET